MLSVDLYLVISFWSISSGPPCRAPHTIYIPYIPGTTYTGCRIYRLTYISASVYTGVPYISGTLYIGYSIYRVTYILSLISLLLWYTLDNFTCKV